MLPSAAVRHVRCYFFFSSRRRHTRLQGDWSSDVCSSDLKQYGTIVSYDLNYRPSLWKSIGGQKRAQEVNKEIAKHVDVMIGNEEDFTACLDRKSTRLNSSHLVISYAVFCLKKKKTKNTKNISNLAQLYVFQQLLATDP